MAEIHLHPIGKIPKQILETVGEGLEEILKYKVVLREEIAIPISAYDQRRGQYTASEILSMLKSKGELVLGVADVDLYAPGLNFVFGQAFPQAKTAIISLSRLRQEFYRLPSDEALFRERAIKEAVHEVGHLLGLGHCPDVKCVMAFSNSLADTDRKGSHFCARCAIRIGRG